MTPRILILLALTTTALPQRPAPPPPTPTVLIDTTLGRLTCHLFAKEAPATTANFIGLATGAKPWTDPATGTPVTNKPFYDGTALWGVSDGITGGDRLGSNKGIAGPPFPTERSPIPAAILLERPGLLLMLNQPAAAAGERPPAGLTSSSLFTLLEHPDMEYEHRGTPFGQCDEASLPIIAAISHAQLTADNHPTTQLGINHIIVLEPGETAPPLTPNLASTDYTPQPAPAPTSATPAPEPTGPTVTMEVTTPSASGPTPLGTITCRLFQQEAPIAVANFVGLATGTKDWHLPTTQALQHGRRFYDGLSFRRVIPDFMIQQADMPNDPSGDGTIGFHFPNEIVPGLTFDRPGRLAYANAGPNTNESEFFITEHPVHRLDGNFTIFGQCDDATVRLVETIARLPRDARNRPLKPVTLRKVTITPASH